MSLSTDHEEASQFGNALTELNISAASSHVGSDGNRTFLTSFGHDLGLLRVKLGVQNTVHDFVTFEHTREQLGSFDRGSPYEDGLTFFVSLLNRLNHGVEFFPTCLEHNVIQINTYIRFIRRDDHDAEAVNFVELGGFRLCRPRHTG